MDPVAIRRVVEAHGSFVAALYGGDIEERDGWYLMRNRHVDEPEWNHAGRVRLADGGALEAMLATARAALRAAGRSLTVVADPCQVPADLDAMLRADGWEEAFRHSGLIWPAGNLPAGSFAWPEAARVTELASRAGTAAPIERESLSSLEAFVSVFEEAFAEVAEGHLSRGYRTAFPASLEPRVAGVEVVHTLVRVEGEPAAIGSRALGGGVAGLYNLGVAPRFRRLGLGGAITLHRVAAAQAAGCDVVYLLTEDLRVEASQRRRGFEKSFELVGLAAPR
jgi:ribosomal protein S18 acetylase RimI-like enzyme